MKLADRYHKWVEWSEEDGTYLGRCPDLITGIHGEDPIRLFADLYEVVEEVIGHFEAEGRPLHQADAGGRLAHESPSSGRCIA